ncbi:MAG: DUF3298 domain-containing protein [Muribaculaceae bacterium]|nr:DUF3298 domain-containing protein [Muribaculaceae bacterium]
MRHFILLITLAIIVLSSSCGGRSVPMPSTADTVAVAVVKVADTTSFKKKNGEICTICADATLCYPTSYVDGATLATLQRIYATVVLEASDTLSLAEAMKQSVTNTLHQYDFTTQRDETQTFPDDESQPVLAYHTSTNVQMHYNRNDLVTFCRVDVVKKDSVVTSVTHRYFTIDLKQMHTVELRDLFRDDALADVGSLLRTRLLDQNKAASNEQLNELGYYNVDNLIATNNFFFDEHGVTWSFQPNELAVSAVGEPCITLSYEALMPLAAENSPLKRLH